MVDVTIPDEETVLEFDASSVGPHAFNFTYFAKADLRVSIDGDELLQAEFSHTPNTSRSGGYDGGSITLNTAVSGGQGRLWRVVQTIRTDNYSSGPLSPLNISRDLTKIVAMAQDARRDVDAALLANVPDLAANASWEEPLAESIATPRPFAIIGRAMNIVVPDVDFTGASFADDGLIEACDQIQDAGTGMLWIPHGSVLKVYDTGETHRLATFEGCRGVELAWNGAIINLARPFSGSDAIFPFVFEDDNENIVIGDHEWVVTNPETAANAFQRGAWFYTFFRRGRGLRIGHVKFTGGKVGVDFWTDDATKRWSNIQIDSIQAFKTGYPLSLRHNGDNLKCERLVPEQCTRPMIAYNWRGNLKVDLREKDCYTQALFFNNTSPSELELSGNTTTGALELKHYGDVRSVAGLGVSSRLALEQRGSSGGYFGPWRISSSVFLEQAGALTQQQIVILKSTAGGVIDSTPTRGHHGEIDLELDVQGAPATSVAWLMAPAASVGDWTGEDVLLRVNRMNVEGDAGSSVYLKHGMATGPTLCDVRMDGSLEPEGTLNDDYEEFNVRDKYGLRSVSAGGVLRTPGGRLTLTTATPVTTGDVTAAATIYYAIDRDNRVPVWMGGRFVERKFAELSLALDSNSGHTGYQQSGKNFDLFVINDAGTLRLASGPAWSSDTSRGTGAGTTELSRSDGFLTNANTMTARFGSASGNTVSVEAGRALYVGTFRATADGQTEDSYAKRFLWNCFNRRARAMRVLETTDTWNYSTATWQQFNAAAANQLDFVRGLDEDAVSASALGFPSSSAVDFRLCRVAVGLDGITGPATGCMVGVVNPNNVERGTAIAVYRGVPGLGRHYLTALEMGAGADTQTWRGDAGVTTVQCGIIGEVLA